MSKFLGLLERGWDVHLVCTYSERAAWSLFPSLNHHPLARRRVHVAWPHQPRWKVIFLAPFALLRGLLFAPRRTFRYISHGWKRMGIGVFRRYYLDLELVLIRPDSVHFEFGALAVGRMDLKELLDCQLSASFRGYDLNFVGLDVPDYYQEIWEEADGLHFLGEDLWRRAQARGCPPDKPHTLIPPAIDTDFFAPVLARQIRQVSTPHPLRILSVGRLDWRKGYEYALQAVRLLVDRGIGCEYKIVGDGDFLEAAAFARHQLGLDDMVTFPGPLPRELVKTSLDWADVFLHAAVSEGFCNAVLEAQAMGVPVVCTDAGGLPENVADGETGFVVLRRDVRALADSLQMLAEDISLRKRMGEAGRQRALERFQLSEQMNSFENFFLVVKDAPT